MILIWFKYAITKIFSIKSRQFLNNHLFIFTVPYKKTAPRLEKQGAETA